MSPEDGLCVVYDALIGVIVGVGEEDVPAFGQRVGVDGEPVVLAGDEAAVGSLVDARLVVAAVTVPERRECWVDNLILVPMSEFKHSHPLVVGCSLASQVLASY